MSALAVGEVVGQLLEAGAKGADVVLLAATPGHRGALEDVMATCRRLLAPAVLAGVVADEAMAAGTASGTGPAVAAWAARCGPVTGRWLQAPARSTGTAAAPATTLVALAGAGGEWPARPWEDAPLFPAAGVAGTAAVALGGEVAGTGGWALELAAAATVRVVRALRPLGPVLPADSDGRLLLRLGGVPAFEQLLCLARDGVAAGDLAEVGAGLHVEAPAGGGAPVAVLGQHRATGGLALAAPIAPGVTARLLVRDRRAVRRGVAAALAGAAGAVVLGAPGIGAALEAGAAGRGGPITACVLPAATLYVGAPATLSGGNPAPGRDAVVVAFSPGR